MKSLNHLQQLEAESIHIMREVAAGFDNPCMCYSIGKDSTVMLHLARKAFAPGKVPLTLLHIDTTWEFAEMASFRDRLVNKHDLDLIVHINEAALAEGGIRLSQDQWSMMREQARFWAWMMSVYCRISLSRKKPVSKNAGYGSEHWAVSLIPVRLKVALRPWAILSLK